MDCEVCDKKFTSKSSYFYHKREKHTFFNCEKISCELCEEEFNSPVTNKSKPEKNSKKCEECRDLTKKLKTRSSLKNGGVFYKECGARVRMDKNKEVELCKLFNCENTIGCLEHKDLKLCEMLKCKYFHDANDNFCPRCRKTENKSKNRYRTSLKDFKKELGGKCVKCGLTDMFFLEFDHIEPSTKKRQITKTRPGDFVTEKDNIQLLCGNCHRIKSFEQNVKFTFDINKKGKRLIKRSKDLILYIKQNIGSCQICKWTIEDPGEFSCATDFDHITGDKYKNISRMFLHKKETIINEIQKCRLLCRNCHQLKTCLERGGKMLDIYYTDGEIQNFINLLDNKKENIEYQKTIRSVIKQIII